MNNSNYNIDDNNNNEDEEGNYNFDNYFKKILNSNSNKDKTSQINSILGKTENIANLIIKDENENNNNNILNVEENKEKSQKKIKKKLDIINETNEKN
jgi:hypothetical protein